MRIVKMDGCGITLEILPNEALDLARACECVEYAVNAGHMRTLPSNDPDARHWRYETLCAAFEAMAVAGQAYGFLLDDGLAVASLKAMRKQPR